MSVTGELRRAKRAAKRAKHFENRRWAASDYVESVCRVYVDMNHAQAKRFIRRFEAREVWKRAA